MLRLIGVVVGIVLVREAGRSLVRGGAQDRGHGDLLHLFLVVLGLGGELALVDGLRELFFALLFLQCLDDLQADLVLRLDHRVGDDLREEVDGADGVVIAGNGDR